VQTNVVIEVRGKSGTKMDEAGEGDEKGMRRK